MLAALSGVMRAHLPPAESTLYERASSRLPVSPSTKHFVRLAWAFRLGCPATQNNLISKFTKMVSAIESTIDQTRHPGMKRTCVRSPDRFHTTNIAHTRCPLKEHSSRRSREVEAMVSRFAWKAQ